MSDRDSSLVLFIYDSLAKLIDTEMLSELSKSGVPAKVEACILLVEEWVNTLLTKIHNMLKDVGIGLYDDCSVFGELQCIDTVAWVLVVIHCPHVDGLAVRRSSVGLEELLESRRDIAAQVGNLRVESRAPDLQSHEA